MSRRDEYRRPAKPGFPAWGVVLIVLGGIGVVGCGVGAVVMAFALSVATRVVQSATAMRATPTYRPLELSALLTEWQQNSVATADKYYWPNGVEVVGEIDEFGGKRGENFFLELCEVGKPKGEVGDLDRARVYVTGTRLTESLKGCEVGDRVRVKVTADPAGNTSNRPILIAQEIEPIR